MSDRSQRSRTAVRELVRVWSSAEQAPRLRRPTDILLLAASIVTLALLALAAPGPLGCRRRAWTRLLAWLEPVFGWLWNIAYAAARPLGAGARPARRP